MTKMRVLALLAVLALFLTLPAVASAQQVPPHVFIGTVTLNGVSAPVGTPLTAYIGGVVQGSTIVGSNGRYGYDPVQSPALMVNQGTGTDITFKVDNLDADETASWEQGASISLT